MIENQKNLGNHEAKATQEPQGSRTALSAHTPGPWTAEPEYEGEAATFVHAKAAPIADCCLGPSMEQDEANARLIAAAPDSHAANIALFEAIHEEYNISAKADDEYIRDTIGSALFHAFFLARAAIAKATEPPK